MCRQWLHKKLKSQSCLSGCKCWRIAFKNIAWQTREPSFAGKSSRSCVFVFSRDRSYNGTSVLYSIAPKIRTSFVNSQGKGNLNLYPRVKTDSDSVMPASRYESYNIFKYLYLYFFNIGKRIQNAIAGFFWLS